MFGYIAPRLDQLTPEQRSRYQAVYCGLCRELGRRSGHSGRLTLSHDMTFLSLLLSSLYEPQETDSVLRCPVHPLRAGRVVRSEMTEYVADMNLLLMYYKCEDHVLDDRSLAGRVGRRALSASLERVSRAWPVQAAAVHSTLDRLWQEEKKAAPDPDLLCNLSGDMLAAVFVPRPDDLWAPVLRQVGAGLGRFVYWLDAWEDLPADLRRGRYNPLRGYRDRKDYDAFVRESLELLLAGAVQPFEVLPLEKDLDILRNVLYSGVWQRYYALQQRNKKEITHGE